MNNEIERKYLVSRINLELENGIEIEQGYLSIDKEKEIRIRISNNIGYITIKIKKSDFKRNEFEYEINVDDAKKLLKYSKGYIIRKDRYIKYFNKKRWEIDIYKDENEGLKIAEIELDNTEEKILLPSWIGEEVTDKKEYKNSNLAKIPYKTWQK